ncbi:MAG: TIGR02266 family protein, partial [Myxococcota bacterium]|nr:TIGR02266 family protein [Myxococcota bacterium]
QQHLEATSQLERARASLGEALGQSQDIPPEKVNVEDVNGMLAKAIRELFALGKVPFASIESLEHIDKAMDHLRSTLVLLQDVGSQDPALERAIATVAKTLAMLYPISRTMAQIAHGRGEMDRLAGSDSRLPNAPSFPVDESIPLPPPKEQAQEAPVQAPRPSQVLRDRRDNGRRRLEVDIGLHTMTNFFTGFVHDISAGGLFVATFDIWPVGTPLNINFSLPPKGPVLSVDGVVRWIRDYNERTPDIDPGMGVMFENLTPEAAEAINRYIAEVPPLFYDHE